MAAKLDLAVLKVCAELPLLLSDLSIADWPWPPPLGFPLPLLDDDGLWWWPVRRWALSAPCTKLKALRSDRLLPVRPSSNSCFSPAALAGVSPPERFEPVLRVGDSLVGVVWPWAAPPALFPEEEPVSLRAGGRVVVEPCRLILAVKTASAASTSDTQP